MRVEVDKRGKLWRLVEKGTGKIAVNANGTALDGGGHEDKAKAERQAGYINAALEKKEQKEQKK